MTSRFVSLAAAWPALLAGMLGSSGMSIACAQQPAAPVAAPVLAAPASTIAPKASAAFRSELEGYQPYSEEKTGDWKGANDSVARIGGWRAYAKEAQSSQPPTPSAKPAPSDGLTKPGVPQR